MRSVGLFEAKTKLSELCEEVATNRKPLLLTRRGQALVKLVPVESEATSSSVWEKRKTWLKAHGPIRQEFRLPKRRVEKSRDPLDG